MFHRKGNIPTPSETYLPVGTFRNELFYVTGPRSEDELETMMTMTNHSNVNSTYTFPEEFMHSGLLAPPLGMI